MKIFSSANLKSVVCIVLLVSANKITNSNSNSQFCNFNCAIYKPGRKKKISQKKDDDNHHRTNCVTKLNEITSTKRSAAINQLNPYLFIRMLSLKMQLIILVLVLLSSCVHATQRRYAPFLIEDASETRKHNRAAGMF